MLCNFEDLSAEFPFNVKRLFSISAHACSSSDRKIDHSVVLKAPQQIKTSIKT
jgi:hypothetical protein